MDKFKEKFKTTQILVLGFILIIFLGGVILSLPVSSKDNTFTPFLDCLFTATSATCVTGLVVVPTAEHWSIFGQIVILLLIQVGGLGFITVMMTALILAGKKITLKERLVIQESFSLSQHSGLVRFIKFLVKFTLLIELTGAFVLTLRFLPDYGLVEAVGMGIFHSVSAFCNAGFDIIGTSSMIPYAEDVTVNLTIMLLVVMGGLGFPVWLELIRLSKGFKNKEFTFKQWVKKISLHSKLALTSTVILIFSGALITFLIEYNNSATMGEYSLKGKILASFFHSVVLRTAGFVSMDYGGLTGASKFISIILMMIGGSPCGTAGGIKTIPIAVIIIAIISLIKDNDSMQAFNRSISFKILQKSLAVVMLMLSILSLATIALCLTEVNMPANFEVVDLMFEVASALGTVGSTVGVTPHLSSIGKIIIITCMFIGRVGPITIAISFMTSNKNKNKIHYPGEDVLVG